MRAGHFDVVIVGGGHGGAQAAIALRQGPFAGTVAIISDEPHLPYERPPLSKDYLSGEKTFERLLIRPAEFWTSRKVDLLLGRRIASVDPAARTLTSETGETFGYGHLIWATGGHARRLTCPGHDLAGVHAVRSRADVDEIMRALPGIDRVVVVGGGYIGLEAAAVLTKLGVAVTVLEAQERVLARVAGVTLSRFYEAEHRAHGVDLRLGTALDRIEGAEGRVTGVRLADGAVIAARMVIVGIGIVPAVGPLLDAGARCANGVAVDGVGRTSLPDVWALGDCALQASDFAQGLPIRLESVQNANEMAKVVAGAIAGEPGAARSVPWFWSNQYDLRLQTVGLSQGYDQEVVRGDPATRAFSVVYLRQGRVIALDCVNATKDYVQGRALIVGAHRPSAAALADTATPLKALAVT